MNQARNEFLARAGFAGYMHRRLRARNLVDHVPQFAHGYRVAKQLRSFSPAAAINLQCVFDNVSEVIQIQWLRDEIKGAKLERLHCGFNVAVSGDHCDRNIRRIHLHPLNEFEPVTVREAHIRQAQVERTGLQKGFRAGDIHRGLGADVHAPEGQRQ